jgi:hypothetical protein
VADESDESQMERTEQDAAPTQEVSYPGALALDVDKYRKYVDHLDLTEERKVELLQTLWSIMATFVKYGFGVDSVQRCIPALAKISFELESDELKETSADEFNGAASEGRDAES